MSAPPSHHFGPHTTCSILASVGRTTILQMRAWMQRLLQGCSRFVNELLLLSSPAPTSPGSSYAIDAQIPRTCRSGFPAAERNEQKPKVSQRVEKINPYRRRLHLWKIRIAFIGTCPSNSPNSVVPSRTVTTMPATASSSRLPLYMASASAGYQDHTQSVMFYALTKFSRTIPGFECCIVPPVLVEGIGVWERQYRTQEHVHLH